jgi:putative membrane protein insertion efficiency factor
LGSASFLLAWAVNHFLEWKIWLVWLILFLSGCFVLSKQMAIGFVRLYQHYSPERLRRRCLFKPTCSEYALLAIEKYGLFKGMKKSFDRLKRCHGEDYRIDYP